MDERDRSKMQLDNLELTSSSPRTEKKRHSERKRQPRQETEMLENPSENQRAHMENHKQPCSSTKVQGRTSQGVGLQTTPNDNEVLQKTRHREKCKKIVFENLAMVMKKEAAKKRLEERALSKTVDEREYERKMKEKQMKRLAAASKSVDTTSDCQTRSANHGREKGYATQTQEAQTFRKSAKKNIVLPPAHQQTTKEAFAYDKQDTLSTDDKLESNQTFEKLDALKQTTPLDSSNLDCAPSVTQGERQQGVSEERNSAQSTLDVLPEESEACLSKKVKSREQRKRIVQDQIAELRKKEAASQALIEEKLFKDMAEKELEGETLDQRQWEIKAARRKSLTAVREDQIQYKKQKKMETDEAERKERQALLESDRVYQVEQTENRRQKTPKLSHANSNTSGKEKHDPWLDRPLSHAKERKSSGKDKTVVDQSTNDQNIQRETCGLREGSKSKLEILEHDGEKYTPEKVKYREKCKKIVCDTMVDIREKEAAKVAVVQENLRRALEEQEFAQETRDRKEREKSATMRKDLTETWVSQIQAKKQKKMETDEAERKARQALLESDRLYQVEQSEKRRQKTPKLSHANSNTDSRKEKRDPWLDRPRSHTKERKSSAQDQNLQTETCESRSGQREGSKSKLEILEHDGEKYTPEKVKYREKCKKIVCDTMVDIREKEAAKVAVVQENLRKALEEQEFAQETRDRKEREKSATMRKDLTETWVSQIQAKKQKKMETDEAERKARQALLESDRLYQIQQSEKRRQKTPKLSHANSNTDSRKEKRDPWLDRPHSHTKEQKPSAQDQNLQTETCESRSGQREGSKSKLEILEHDGEKYTPEKVKYREKCKKIVCDTMVDIREKEAAKVAVVQENLRKALEEQEFAQETRDRKEREKSATMRKDLTETWVSQIQAKKQKKMETDEAERKARQALLESDRLYQIQQSEKRRQKTFQVCEATSTQDFPKDKHDRQLKESDEKLSKQEELELEQLMQDQFSEEDEDFDKFEFLQDNVPESVKSRERRTKRVSEELALIRKREAAEMALLEENLLRNMENQEAAATARETQEKEKKAAIGKVLTEAWDYQVQYKEQQKKERCETECKERRSLIELDRLYEIEKQKRIELQKKKASVNREKDIALAESRRAKIRNQSHGGMKGAFPPLMPLKSLQRGATSDANVKHVDPLPKPGPLLQRRHNLANRPPPSPEPPIPNRIVLDGNSTASIKTPFKLPSIDGHVRKTPMPFFEFSRPRRSVFKEDSTATEKTTLKLPPIHSPPSRPARSRGQKTNQGRL